MPVSQPKIGVSLAIYQHSKLLVSKRRGVKDKNYEGYWQFPGGHLDLKESLLDAAIRETLEETGLTEHVGKCLRAQSTVLTVYDGHLALDNWMAVAFRSTAVIEQLPKNPEPAKHTDWEWLTPMDLLDLEADLLPGMYDVLVKMRGI